MSASDVERFHNAPPETPPFPYFKISDTFRIKTGYGQNEETQGEHEEESKTFPTQTSARVQKISPRLPLVERFNAYAETKHKESSSPNHHSNSTEIWVSKPRISYNPSISLAEGTDR